MVEQAQNLQSRFLLIVRKRWPAPVLAIIGPTLGTSISRLAFRSQRAALAICRSSIRSSASSACQCLASTNNVQRKFSGMSSHGCSSVPSGSRLEFGVRILR